MLDDDDGKAAEIYARMIDRFPVGRVRGARRPGKQDGGPTASSNFAETIRIFERGAATLPAVRLSALVALLERRASYDQLGDRAQRRSAIV